MLEDKPTRVLKLAWRAHQSETRDNKAAGRMFDGLLIQARAGALWSGCQTATEKKRMIRDKLTLLALCSGHPHVRGSHWWRCPHL
jgi:hypothetical protein